jgi:hypothetical protein
MLIAIPNGANVSDENRARLVREGLTAGAYDLQLIQPNRFYHGLFIEMKTDDGRVSHDQKRFKERAEAQGYKCVVCRSFDEFRAEIEQYLAASLSNL